MISQTKKPGLIYKTIRDIFYLTWSQLLNIRTGWVWYILLSSFIPIVTLFFLFMILGYQIGFANYVVTGNIVFSVVIGSLNTLANQMGWMKQNRYFEHYAALPVSRMSLIIALVMRCTLFSMPAMAAVLITGKLLFRIPITLHPLLIPLFIISGFALSGIGAVIGIYSKNSNHANIVTQVVFPILVFAAPVMVPAKNLPVFLQYFSIVLPTTYIAEAFRDSLGGNTGADFFINLIIITLYTILSLYLVTRKFDWRVD